MQDSHIKKQRNTEENRGKQEKTGEGRTNVVYFVEIPNFEHGFGIMKRVLKKAISGGEGIMLAPENGGIRED